MKLSPAHPSRKLITWLISILMMTLVFCGVGYGQQLMLPHFSYSKIQSVKPDLSQYDRVRFLTIVDFAPFNYLNQKGLLRGYHIDLIRALCEELDITERCQIEALPFNELQGKLLSKDGEVIIAGLLPSADNREFLRFSKSYLVFPARFIGFETSNSQQSFDDQLKDIKVGVVANTNHEIMLRSYFPKANIIDYRDYDALYKAVLSSEVQLGFGDGLRFSLWLSKLDIGALENDSKFGFVGGAYMNRALLGGAMQIAVSMQDANLAKAFDYALDRLEKNGKLQELYLRYFPIGFY